MSTPLRALTPARRRALLGSSLALAIAAFATPALAAPLSAARAATAAARPRPLLSPSSAHAYLQSSTVASLTPSLETQRLLAREAERARRQEFRTVRARAIAVRKASRARAHRLRVLHDSTARLIPLATSYTLSARFGERSGLWGTNIHTGLDFDAPYGSVVRSTRMGTVSFAGWAGPYGNCVVVNHGNGLQTRYAHMSHMSVTVGEHVWAGQQVGNLGNTGNTTGPHLHFEVIVNGTPVDPAQWLW